MSQQGNAAMFPPPQSAATGFAVVPNTCRKCGIDGCDVQMMDCSCCFHARCTPVSVGSSMTNCPGCGREMRGIYLLPMSFEEIDEARKAAAHAATVSGKRGKKRKNATIARLNPEVSARTGSVGDDTGGDSSEARTGRWTDEEIAYCDKLVETFELGQLPVVDGVKLNEFLAGMLKSKQSRLTKKMKNAKLSAKTFKGTTGYIMDAAAAREFSELENAFIRSIECSMERAEIHFHVQKEWRELFSNYCVKAGQHLDADTWLSSVEELDRRMSKAKDAARMARRKKMMGYALSQDRLNPDQGVFIDRTGLEDVRGSAGNNGSVGLDELASLFQLHEPPGLMQNGSRKAKFGRVQKPPFLGKVLTYMYRHNIPFEHVDAWVPSFVSAGDVAAGPQSKCRLCFAGAATMDTQVLATGRGTQTISNDDQFDWFAFGEYSQKFSFDIGCGLPGRVYQRGVPCWEQNVEHAPHHHFERCGGAAQWGIKTVVAVPIPSPSVGRIVVLFYSRHDRAQDPDMVGRMSKELGKLLPSPKWKLVVDIGNPNVERSDTEGSETLSKTVASDSRVPEVLTLIRENTPRDSSSPLAGLLPGFTSLQLVLVKSSHSQRECQTLMTLLASYSSYASSGRSKSDIAVLLARDYMMLSQQSTSHAHAPPTSQQLSQNSQGPVGNNGSMNPLPVPPSGGNGGYVGGNGLMNPLPVPPSGGNGGPVGNGLMSHLPLQPSGGNGQLFG